MNRFSEEDDPQRLHRCWVDSLNPSFEVTSMTGSILDAGKVADG
jgi:hypothetical protein